MSCNALAHATWSWLDNMELKWCVRWFCSKMPGKWSFNHKWLTMEEHKCARRVKCDLKKAICIVRNETIALTMMGKSALRSHMAGNNSKYYEAIFTEKRFGSSEEYFCGNNKSGEKSYFQSQQRYVTEHPTTSCQGCVNIVWEISFRFSVFQQKWCTQV